MQTPIDWMKAQQRLSVKPDANPGPLTYTALFSRLGAIAGPATALAAAATLQFPKFGISTTIERLADFLAQGAHETGGFRVWEENMRYSAARLHAVFPARFPTVASAIAYAWDPKDPDREDIALADKIYGDRMGNQLNGLKDDDGWNSRGMGLLMMTGLANRRAAQRRLGLDLTTYPDLAADPATSLLIACDFYRANGVLAAIDDGDLIGARRIVNVGDRKSKVTPIGWNDVESWRRRVLAIIA